MNNHAINITFPKWNTSSDNSSSSSMGVGGDIKVIQFVNAKQHSFTVPHVTHKHYHNDVVLITNTGIVGTTITATSHTYQHDNDM